MSKAFSLAGTGNVFSLDNWTRVCVFAVHITK